MSATKESVYAWFDEYEKILKEHNITGPHQIYNADETGFPLQEGTRGKVIVNRHSKRHFQIAGSSKKNITTLQCICADGSDIAPAIIYPGKVFNAEYALPYPEDYFLGFSDSGWMTTE